MPAYRIRTVFTGVPGTPWMSNFWFDASTVGSAEDAKDAAYAFWNAIDQYMANNINWNIDQDVPLYSSPDTLAGWETVTAGTGNGQLSAVMLPFATQALVQWATSTVFNNRRVRGRTFIPGLTEDSNSDGVLAFTHQTAFETAAETLSGTGLCIASKASNSFVLVSAADVWSQFAVMRSRRD